MPTGVYPRTEQHHLMRLGRKHSEKTIEKLRESHKGERPWRKGVSVPALQNEKNPLWKGDKVSYGGLHAWVKRHLGRPLHCTACGFESENTHQFHWANISHEYRRDLSDWVRLCVSCHRAYDKYELTLNQIGIIE